MGEGLLKGNPMGQITHFDCDFCGRKHPHHDRVVAATPRPSDPLELVAVMWGCGNIGCGSVELPTATEIFDSVEETGQWQGTPYLFVSV